VLKEIGIKLRQNYLNYSRAAAISVLVHALVFLTAKYTVSVGKKNIPLQPTDTLPALSFIPPEDSLLFIPSETMAKTQTAPEATRRISDQNTIMRGEIHRSDADRADQSGRIAEELVFQDTPESLEQNGFFSDPIPKVARSDNSSAQRSANNSSKLTDTTSSQRFDITTASSNNGNLLANNTNSLSQQKVDLPHIPSSTSSTVPVENHTSSQAATTSTNVSSVQPNTALATTRLSFHEKKTEIQGQAPLKGLSSWSAEKTTLGEYQAEIYRRVGTLWHKMIRQRLSLISCGRVVAQVEISASGKINKLVLTEWPTQGTMLGVISETSIRQAAPFPPFTQNLRQQLGETLRMEISFLVY